MKFLVTGGAGFIGSHLVAALRSSESDVVVIDNYSTGQESNVPNGVDVRRGDVGDRGLLDQVLPGCSCVFHLAAVSSVQASLDRPVSVHEDNLTATLTLLQAAKEHGVKRFVFSSSAAVYGDTLGALAHEGMTPKPTSHYAVQKLACEHYCNVYARVYGLETVSLRYFNVFGPRQRADSPYCGAIARFLDAARLGHAPTVYGDGSQTRDFCPVANIVTANIAAAQVSPDKVAGMAFNIGSGTAVSINRILECIRRAVPDLAQAHYTSARLGEIQHSCADISLARERLEYRPTVGMEEALRELSCIELTK